ncbi:MAG: phosphatase PAP2 family protein [Chitinophagales bacterium]
MNITARKVITSFLCVVFCCNYCFSQLIDLGLSGYKTSIETPYNLDKQKDLAVSLSAVALIGTGFFLKSLKPSIDSIDLVNPDISKIPSFDISAIHQSNPGYQKASDILEYVAVALPFLAFVDKRVSGHGGQIVFMYLETLALDFALYNMTTGLVNRRRPLTFNTDTHVEIINGIESIVSDVPQSSKERAGVLESFFSGHTCNAATATFFGARVFTDLRPQSKLVPFVWIAAAGVPAFTAFSRYKAGKHFPSDVIVGYLVGASVGYFVPQFHKYHYLKNLSFSPTFENKGMAMTYRF